MFLLGIPLDTPEIRRMREMHDFPSMQTCKRIVEQYRTLGHWLPKRPTGNHDAEREVLGEDLVLLSLYRLVHPEATVAHIQAFLFNMNPTQVPYFPIKIMCAESLLGLWRKVSSTTCKRAHWPSNLHKRDCFWRKNYPLGRADVLTKDMIDMDQAGMKIEASNPNFGKCVSWERCHFDGAYNREQKLNLMMAVSADTALDMEWHDYWRQEEGGTNLYRVYIFLRGSWIGFTTISLGDPFVSRWTTSQHPPQPNLARPHR